MLKMNSLVDARCIRALYEASQAGVQVDLACAASAACGRACRASRRTSRVVSVVGRFLEHSRIYGFQRGDERQLLDRARADLMPRNLDTRVELLAPVEDESLRAELEDTVERCLADDTYGWELRPDGDWSAAAAASAACTRS